jgi:hypothetical protein
LPVVFFILIFAGVPIGGITAHTVQPLYLFLLAVLVQSSIPAMRQPGLCAIPAKPSEIEKQKTDYLKTIVSVRPVAGDRD